MSADPKKPDSLSDKKDAAMEKEMSKKDPAKIAEESPGSTTEVSPSDAMAKQPGFDKLKE